MLIDKIKRQHRYLVALMLLFSAQQLVAQGTLADYQRAQTYFHLNVDKLVKNINLWPQWDNSGLWYKTETNSGYRFVTANPQNGKVSQAFSHEVLAKALSAELGKSISPDSLPFSRFTYDDGRSAIRFNVKENHYSFNLKSEALSRVEVKALPAKNESVSPDSTVKVLIRNHNLYLVNLKTGEERQLTADGVDRYDYATPGSWYQVTDVEVGEQYDPEIDITWSPDSKRFVTYKLDRRKAKRMYLFQSLPDSGYRAKVWFYERPLPGEDTPKMVEYFVFDVDKGSSVRVNIAPFADFLGNMGPAWLPDGKRLYLSHFIRGYQGLNFYVVDAVTGNAQTLFEERSETNIEYQMAFGEVTSDGNHLVWASERDGWSHLYLYDLNTMQLVRQLTKGEYVVRSIAHVDAKAKRIWFVAGGKEAGRNPYYQHLYSVGFDGKKVTLLTPEDAEHEVVLSPNGKWFVDNYSRIDMPTVSVLRRLTDGKLVGELQRADVSKLLATGYRYPQQFVAKGRDGKTDIYGAIFYPSTFSTATVYPVIDGTYSGPQHVRTPRSFARAFRNSDQPLAELGFIVVTIDGMGTAMRSKAFHDMSWKNLGDIGAPDHIAFIKQLARVHSFVDSTRVGIYGHSAGGYDAAHALLAHPDFYSVGVSSAGNHDHRMSKAWWPEQYMGLPGKHFDEQSNLNLAQNLKGKLLLVHGDMDQNVNPANSLRLGAMFQKYNKDYDLLIIPNHDHDLYNNLYFTRKRWDYFVQHLLGVTPPREFQIEVKK